MAFTLIVNQFTAILNVHNDISLNMLWNGMETIWQFAIVNYTQNSMESIFITAVSGYMSLIDWNIMNNVDKKDKMQATSIIIYM